MRIFALSGGAAVFAASPASVFALDINTILTILGAAGGGAAAWKIVGLLLDKIVPSRSDKRSEIEVSMAALAKTIEILSSEKASDAQAIARANVRISELEADGGKDYDLIRVLKDSIADLERRIAKKDQHIAMLGQKLAEFGLLVVFDGEGHLKIQQRTPTGPIPVQHSA